MICGGSPCQDFSVAGKQKGSVWTCKDCGHEYNPLTVHWSQRDKCPNCSSKNIEKTRSSLLVEYLRVIRANKPNFGMYENVKNIVGKQFKDTTFKLFEDELHEYGYNTYWKVLNAKDFGIPQNRERVYLIFIKKDLDNGKFVFPEGFDNGIRLKDVLEDEVDEKYYISDDKVQRFLTNLKLNNEHITDVPVRLGNVYGEQFGTGYAGNVWDKEAISPTLMTMQGGGRQPHIMCGIDKSVNDTNLSSHSWECNNFVKEQIRIRKLSPKECFRLMGFFDSAYEAASKVVSNSQLYKQAGNSIVVDVLYYILVELYKEMPYLFDDLKLSSFFSGVGAFECSLDLLYERIINYDRSDLDIKTCEICGSDKRVQHNGATNMFLCNKHRRQIYKYGDITDPSSYNQKDKNDIGIHEDYALLVLRNKSGDITGKSIIDMDDIDIVKQYKWTLGNHGYVTSGAGKNQILLHRLLSNAFDGIYVDHINRNKLDNRKLNYRFCTNQENNRNKDLYSHNSSGITGVTWNKDRNKWQAQIVVDDKNINLGRYDSFDDAVKARLDGEKKYFKDFMPEDRTGLYESINTGNFTNPQVE